MTTTGSSSRRARPGNRRSSAGSSRSPTSGCPGRGRAGRRSSYRHRPRSWAAWRATGRWRSRLVGVEGSGCPDRGRQRRHRRGQDRHRVGVAGKPLKNSLRSSCNKRIPAHLASKAANSALRGGQCRISRGGLEEVGVLGELLDRVAAIADPLSPSMKVMALEHEAVLTKPVSRSSHRRSPEQGRDVESVSCPRSPAPRNVSCLSPTVRVPLRASPSAMARRYPHSGRAAGGEVLLLQMPRMPP